MIGALIARKAVAGAFDALNRHNLQQFMSGWSDDGVFIYPGDIPESGTFRGKTAIEGWFRRFLEQFTSIRFEIHDLCVRNIFDTAGTNVLAVHWTIHLTNREGRVGENAGVTVVSIAGGKVSQAKDYIFDLGENFRRNWSAPTGAGA
jgi:ketosteroid isomerase-like protein